MTGPESGDPLAGLNGAQRAAATHRGGPLIVLAGPGTGKTRVIIARIAHLVREDGVDPKSVLALTFTNKAAGELRERLASMLGAGPAEAIGACTFNAFGANLLRRFADLAGLPHEPGLLDSAQRKRMMRKVVAERGLFADALATGLDSAIEAAGKLIGAMQCAGLTIERARRLVEERVRALDSGVEADPDRAASERARAGRLCEVVELWAGFDRACLEGGLVSFDDQVSRTNLLLSRNGTARAFVRADYRHIVVDEFQDVNLAQIGLLRHLAPPEASPDLCVVGDDDQAIYAFRGSDDRSFQRFEAAWKGTRTVTLEENYRSASPILRVAGAIIGRAHERFREEKLVRRADALGPDPAGSGVEAIRLENFRQAGEVIASMVRRSMESTPGRTLGSHAVIARTWNDLDAIRGALEVEGIPARMSRPREPRRDEGVLDVLAWMESLLNPRSSWPVRRLMRRPPNQLETDAVTRLEHAYEAARSRGEAGPFALWAATEGAERIGADERVRSALSRLAGLWTALRDLSASMPASAVIGEIVRRSDVVHADLLDGRARAARVSAVVGLMRFAAEREDRLDPPADLRAFMDYYRDLEDKEQTLAPDRLTHGDIEGDEAGENGADAVHLLSAHSAKGLEFDTVFVPRVESKHGYPSVRAPDDETTLPGWMVEDGGSGRSAIEALQDEERRLFYVACTRAQRRLVLLGQVPRASKALNFMVELLGEGGLVVEREAAEALGPHAGDDVERMTRALTWDASVRRREAIRSARRGARLDAASALDAADRGGLDEAGLGEVLSRLEGAAKRLAAVARGESGDELPGWLAEPGLAALHAALRGAAAEDGSPVSASEAVLKPLAGPLRLSYTALKHWEDCPRCYFVNHVLRLPQPEGRPIVVGKAVHTALERFYTRVGRAGERGEPGPGLADLLALGDAAFHGSVARDDAIDPEQFEQVRALLRICYERLHTETINPVGIEQVIAFDYARRGTHRIVAKIDRLDSEGGRYRIVDYKTGRASKALTQPEKDDFQFGIYRLALRSMLNGGRWDGADEPAGGAEYWVLSTGERGVVGFETLAKAEKKTLGRIDRAIDGMLDGDWPRGKQCSGACEILEAGGSRG
jgi:DNA helicase-2/ATP-dependent DNA helicase PcrA